MRNAVLVVEDDAEVRGFLREALLFHSDFHINEAATVPQGMSLLREVKPNLVLVDVVLPGPGTGLSVARAAADEGIPVLLMTGGEIKAELDIASSGFPCLQKPFQIDELFKRVDAALGKGKELQQQSAQSLKIARENRKKSAALAQEIAEIAASVEVAIKQAQERLRTRAIEREVMASATLWIERFSSRAEIEASSMVRKMVAKRDEEGASIWRRVSAAIRGPKARRPTRGD